MKNSVKLLLVTALVAPVLFLTGCNCGGCDKPCPSYDKCGTQYSEKDGCGK